MASVLRALVTTVMTPDSVKFGTFLDQQMAVSQADCAQWS
jgi:hypothetical protein